MRRPRPAHALDHQRSIVAVGLAMFVVGLNTTGIGVATRGIAEELGVSADTLSWIVGAYLLTAASFSLIGGRLGDVAGRARTFVAGLGVFSVGAVIAAVAPSSTVLIIGRLVEGLGAALVLPSSIELVAAHPPPQGTSGGFRARSIVYTCAFGMGPLIGGLFTDHVSWRALFWFELVLLVPAMILAWPLVAKASELPKPPTRDLRGAVLTSLLVATALLSLYRVPGWGWWSWPTLVAAVVVALLAVALVRVEATTPHPILHRRVVTNRTVLGANLATLAASIGMVGLLYFFNLFAQSAAVFDSTALSVAVALIPFTLTMIGFSLLARSLTNRLGYRGPVGIGLGLATIGFFWLSATSGTTSKLDLAVPLVLCGVGAGIANAGLTRPAVLTLPRTRLDEAAGLFSLSRYVGSALAVAIGSSAYLSVATQLAPPPESNASMESIVVGRSAFQQALTTLAEDLRGPFEAATRAQTAEAFASTMRLAGVAIAGLTVASALLLRAGTRRGDTAALAEPAPEAN